MDFSRPLQTVTPTLDGDVLGVLVRGEVEMSGREIQRVAGHGSAQGIRNAADRLVSQGVLRRRSVGGAHLYSLNRDHLAAAWIEGLAGMTSQLLDRLRSEIASWRTRPVAVLLFGSAATGTATPESDFDLLVVRTGSCDAEAPDWRAQLAGLEERATAWSGNDARILEYGQGEISSAGAEAVLRDALTNGIVLYGSKRALRALVRGDEAG